MAGPKSVRYINEVRTLDLLFRDGNTSRADIAKQLQMSRSTVTNIVSGLVEQGLVLEQNGTKIETPDRPSIGRPGIQIGLQGDGAFFVGVEIGVHVLRFVVLDLAANTYFNVEVPHNTGDARPEQVVDTIVSHLEGYVARGIDKDRIKGVALSIPALVDHAGFVRNAPLIGWKNLPLRAMLAELLTTRGFSVDVEVINDAAALAIAETRKGTGKRARTILFLNMENGLGGAIVDNEKLFAGNDGLAGEVGHFPIGPEVKRRRFGRQLETLVGHDAILARFAALGCKCDTIHEAVQALAAGNAQAKEAADEWAYYLSLGLITLINVINPGLIVLGGTVAEIFPYVADDIDALLRAELVSGLPIPIIEQSTLGNMGPAVGAASLLHQRTFSIDERILNQSFLQS